MRSGRSLWFLVAVGTAGSTPTVAQIKFTQEQQDAAEAVMRDARKNAPIADKIIATLPHAQAMMGLSPKELAETIADEATRDSIKGQFPDSLTALSDNPTPVTSFMNNVVRTYDAFDALGARGNAKTNPTEPPRTTNKFMDPSKVRIGNGDFVCTPIGIDMSYVRINPNLEFRNECTAGNGVRNADGTGDVIGYFVVACRGWYRYTVKSAAQTFPDQVYGRVETRNNARVYSGYGFASPCTPKSGVGLSGGLMEILGPLLQ